MQQQPRCPTRTQPTLSRSQSGRQTCQTRDSGKAKSSRVCRRAPAAPSSKSKRSHLPARRKRKAVQPIRHSLKLSSATLNSERAKGISWLQMRADTLYRMRRAPSSFFRRCRRWTRGNGALWLRMWTTHIALLMIVRLMICTIASHKALLKMIAISALSQSPSWARTPHSQ
jgi:hypothetical protein